MNNINEYITEKLHINKDSKYKKYLYFSNKIEEGKEAIMIIMNDATSAPFINFTNYYIEKINDDCIIYKGVTKDGTPWETPTKISGTFKNKKGYYEYKDKTSHHLIVPLSIGIKLILDFSKIEVDKEPEYVELSKYGIDKLYSKTVPKYVRFDGASTYNINRMKEYFKL